MVSATDGGPPEQSDVVMLLIYVVLALACSFLCSVAEAVLLSIPPSYIGALAQTKPRQAERLRILKQDKIDQSLAAILTLNTIAHTAGAILAGAKATVVFGSAWFGVFSAVMTLMILFLSEIVPKTFGAVYWTRLVGPTVWFVQVLVVLLYPLVWISERLTRLIAKDSKIHAFSREEFLSMARMGEEAGQLRGTESRIIKNLFRFSSLSASDVMTPRTVVFALPEDARLSEVLGAVNERRFSRIPLYREDLDQITGFALRDEILGGNTGSEETQPLRSIARPIPEVLDSSPLPALLETFIESHNHIAIVVDEFGGTKGLITLEDLLETLVGKEIMDETDDVRDMRAYARRVWRKRARELGIDSDQAANASPASDA